MKKLLFITLSLFCFSAMTLEAKSIEKHDCITIQKTEAMALTYITEPQFIAMMSEQDLTDLTDNMEENEKSALMQEVNNEAVSEIDAYLLNRYKLPAEGTDGKLTTMTKDLMKFRLYKRRDELNLPDNVVKLYNSVVKDLEKIASGTINLKISKAESGGEGSYTQGIQSSNRPKVNRYNLS